MNLGLNFPGVTQHLWKMIKSGEWLLVKLKNQPRVYLLEMLDNKFGHPEAPSACFGLPDKKSATVLKQADIIKIRRYVGAMPISK